MDVNARPGTRLAAVAAALGLGIAGLFVGVAVALFAVAIVGTAVPLPPEGVARTAITLVGQGVGVLLVGGLYLSSREQSLAYVRLRRPTPREFLWAILAVVVLFAALLSALYAAAALGLSVTEHGVADPARTNPAILLPLIPLSVLVTGPAEEFLYRGVVQTRLREVFGPASAVVLAAVVFALVHIPAYAAGGLGTALLTTLGILFLLGGVLGAVYEHTGNLVVPAIAHGVYNAVTFGLDYLEAVGGF